MSGAAAKTQLVVGRGKFGDGGGHRAVGQRVGELDGRIPRGLLETPALQNVEHPPIEQGGVAHIGLAPAHAFHAAAHGDWYSHRAHVRKRPVRPTQNLTEGAIAKTLLVFTLPVLAGNILQTMNGSVNAVWIGHYLGKSALTASSNANAILFFLIGVMFGVGMATTILIGQSVGKRDVEQAKRIVGTSATFFTLISVVLSAIGFFASPTVMRWRGRKR